jgi:hypothetical protein
MIWIRGLVVATRLAVVHRLVDEVGHRSGRCERCGAALVALAFVPQPKMGEDPADHGWIFDEGDDLHCPEEDGACVDQAPPAPGDGCDETLAWWFSEATEKERLKRSREPPARHLTLEDLPPESRSVLSAP